MSSELAIRGDQEGFSAKQIAALHQLGVKDASNADLAVFFHQATRTGLDPFAKQIYMISRSQYNPQTREYEAKQTIQTGIDGFRLIARRSADRAGHKFGYEDTLWASEDGVWSSVWLSRQPPRAAMVTVVRDGQRFPAVALYDEYVQMTGRGENQKPNSMWARMPANQLAKCAEALALRKAFPQDLSGLYTEDEMAQADGEVAVTQAEEPQETSEEHDRRRQKRMFALFNELDMKGRDAQVGWCQAVIGRDLTSRANMTADEVEQVIESLETEQRERQGAGVTDAEVVEGPMVPSGVNAETGEVTDPWATEDGGS